MKRLKKMKNIICLFILSCFVVPAVASYDFTDTLAQTASIDVEYWTGSGSSETILVIDWNQSGNWNTESHAFGYKWDGSATTLTDMFDAITGNGGLEITMVTGSQFGDYIGNFLFTDQDGDQHVHDEQGSFNYASTGDVFAEWGEMNWANYTIGDWQANYGIPDDEYITHGQLEAVNACYYNHPTNVSQALDVPYVVPEPATLALMSLGGILLRRRK